MVTPWTIPTRPTGTPFTPRVDISTPWDGRNDVVFICTEILDFLMTESNDYLITDESPQISTNWTIRATI